uniref:Mfs general substrate transporter n=1 Tax=Tetraselmis sp. GSL018 TaxID=582737 RepID=A0A061REG6_9CHLO|eukprot:CAMPEP_0177590858 /NCGR_PEP_ID=MMETSP0419_2-20121207/7656_1 /TAXON_ID=582737 /ORGANISM="Tetraselmis sp., Strain GSL018" /LENGTH=482 /DNA_ID=CAMNT_0019081497 /DNA_START=171 /DNA_END=1619 /DNA_ORIENTATION=+
MAEEVPLISTEATQARILHPAWFTPPRLLALFCGISLLVYIDRGALSSNGVNGSPRTQENPRGEGIQGDFALTYFEDGLLPAVFMVGLLVASAAFAEATKYHNAMRLIGVGLAVWTAGVAACAAATGFPLLLAARSVMGAGEASFLALAAPFIDDVAPPRTKTLWFATFYMTNTTGYALGYIVGGLLGPAVGWRGVFVAEALLMLPFVAFTLLAKPVELRSLKNTKPPGSGQGSRRPTGGAMRTLAEAAAHFLQVCKHRVFVMNALGQTLWTATVGALAYWGPKAARELFGLGPEWVDLLFGGLTAVTSIAGTLAGAALSDYLGSSLRRSMVVSGAVTGIAFLSLEVSFLSSVSISFPVFMVVFGFGMLFLFGASGPSNAVNMWSVPVGLRPQAVSFSTIMSHLLGDVPSPPVLGWLEGRLGRWDASMALCNLLIMGSSAFYFAGSALAGPTADHRVTEPNPEHPEEAQEHMHDDGPRISAS